MNELVKRQPITVVLPYPPSYNAYWRTSRNGSYISADGKAYKDAAAQRLETAQIVPVVGNVKVALDFFRPRKSGDLDNRIKQVLDALQGHAYDNDAQVVDLHARRFDDKDNPRVEVRVVPVVLKENA